MGLRLNLEFSDELTNKDSPEYVAFSKNFENTMLPEVQKGISNAIGIQVTDVRSGSIIVSFNVITKESTTGAPKVKASDVLTKVKNIVASGNISSLKPDVSTLPSIKGEIV